MIRVIKLLISLLVITMLNWGCIQRGIDTEKHIAYCMDKVTLTLHDGVETGTFPRNIGEGETSWNGTRISNWTVGFWSGMLWYLYEYDQDEQWLQHAIHYTSDLESVKDLTFNTHDLGVMAYPSFGHGYRLTGDPDYRQIMLATADKLVQLYESNTGTLLSWPWMIDIWDWPHHTVITSIMNLNILFWASKNGRPDYYDMAVRHADAVMEHLIRTDYTTWQVVHLDTLSRKAIRKHSFNGLNDNSTWSRGQAFAIYGFTNAFVETGEQRFLAAAQGLASAFIDRLPADYVPYWDLDVEVPEDKVKDVSAAAIAASALMELSRHTRSNRLKNKYFHAGEKIIEHLSEAPYRSNKVNNAFLLHGVGDWNSQSEVDVSLIYADYYYLESLIRYRQIQQAD